MPGRDPFGFRSSRSSARPSPGGTNPLTVVAEPGQEIRVVVPLDPDDVRGAPGDSRASPRPATDSRASPRPRTDAAGSDPFGFGAVVQQPSYSPRPVTIVARPGQEIHVVVPEGGVAMSGPPADSRASPRPAQDAGGDRGRRRRREARPGHKSKG
jgi:hypothetical protein